VFIPVLYNLTQPQRVAVGGEATLDIALAGDLRGRIAVAGAASFALDMFGSVIRGSFGRYATTLAPFTTFHLDIVSVTAFETAVAPYRVFSTEVPMGLKVGATATIRTTLRVDGVATDPTTLQCTVHDPSGTETVYVYGVAPELTRMATGKFELRVECTIEGQWAYKWRSTGAAKGADENVFTVDRPVF
jgi:hypothetical protein